MIEIKWNDLIMVAGASIGATALVVALFSIGVRLLTDAQHAVAGKGKDKKKSVTKEIAFRLSAFVAFALASSVMAYGLFILVTFSKLDPK